MNDAHFNFNTKNRDIIFWRPIEVFSPLFITQSYFDN